MIADHQLAARAARRNRHFEPQKSGQIPLQRQDIGVLSARAALFGTRGPAALDEAFGLANVKAAPHHLTGQGLGLADLEQGAGMARGQGPGVQELLHRLGQGQQANQIGHMAAALAHHARQLLLGARELFQQPTVAFGLLQGRKVLTLDILDQGDLQDFPVGQVFYDDRHLVKPGLLRRPPPPLAGDDLVSLGRFGMAPHQNGLKDALFPHRLDERLHFRFVETAAGLKGAWMDHLDRHRPGGAAAIERRVVLAFLAQKRRQPAPQVAARGFIRAHGTVLMEPSPARA